MTTPIATQSDVHVRKRPLILISNDDGIDAPGLRALAWALAGLGTLYVVAPLTEQSAVGHAITVRDPVRVRPWPFDGPPDVAGGLCRRRGRRRTASSSPSTSSCPGGRIWLSAASTRGRIRPSTLSTAAPSALPPKPPSWASTPWPFRCAGGKGGTSNRPVATPRRIAEAVLRRGLPPGLLLNVNVPALSFDEIKGIRTTRQARSRWEESFIDPRRPRQPALLLAHRPLRQPGRRRRTPTWGPSRRGMSPSPPSSTI
ncbi:MAG: hypothetical protein KatS3mg043_1971 [Rhodothermaceae bacterium]|nr:MAG: hypothetical protein KatS3mg043_1971 [Rhodothermaceae bacterium]